MSEGSWRRLLQLKYIYCYALYTKNFVSLCRLEKIINNLINE